MTTHNLCAGPSADDGVELYTCVMHLGFFVALVAIARSVFWHQGILVLAFRSFEEKMNLLIACSDLSTGF